MFAGGKADLGACGDEAVDVTQDGLGGDVDVRDVVVVGDVMQSDAVDSVDGCLQVLYFRIKLQQAPDRRDGPCQSQEGR
eukprot:2959486-Pyramimonas_sp.AAC.1